MITILGPTACGKTSFAAHLADKTDAEIISADSRQVYRRMDIGTGKDLADYDVDGHHIPYHLIDIVEPGTRYNVYQFQRDFLRAYDDIRSRGKQVILCGGTGLYIESVARNYRIEKNEQHVNQRLATIAEENLIVGLRIDRELRRQRISQRLRQRLDEGMVDEIRGLLDSGVKAEALLRYGLEYKFVTLYLLGQLTYDEMYRLLEIAIHQFAKRQMTYFRGMEERRGVHIHWIEATLPTEEKIEIVKKLHS